MTWKELWWEDDLPAGIMVEVLGEGLLFCLQRSIDKKKNSHNGQSEE
jgi:hypothetical protein